MLAECPAHTWWEWAAFNKTDPISDQRADLRTAQICATIANAHRKKGRRSYTAKDFMPKFGKPRGQSWKEQLKVIEELNRAFGGDDLRKERQQQ